MAKSASERLRGAKKKPETLDPLAPTEEGHWRLIVDFPPDLAAKVQAEAARLGVNFQATVKTLVDEALRLRAPALKRGHA